MTPWLCTVLISSSALALTNQQRFRPRLQTKGDTCMASPSMTRTLLVTSPFTYVHLHTLRPSQYAAPEERDCRFKALQDTLSAYDGLNLNFRDCRMTLGISSDSDRTFEEHFEAANPKSWGTGQRIWCGPSRQNSSYHHFLLIFRCSWWWICECIASTLH